MKHRTNRNCGRAKRIADKRAKRHAEYEAQQREYVDELHEILAYLKEHHCPVKYNGVLLPASAAIYAIEKELKRHETR